MAPPIDPFEPEETVGKIWHRMSAGFAAPDSHVDHAVALDEIAGRLGVFFRGLGGAGAVEIKPVGEETSLHRLPRLRRLGTFAETVPRASFDGAVLRLPEQLAVFPAREANGALYLWLAALSAHAGATPVARDPLVADLQALAAARHMIGATLVDAPGLGPLHADLAAACLALRKVPALPETEQAVEALVRDLLGAADALPPLAARMLKAIETGDFTDIRAPRRYRPFHPVPLWPDLRLPSVNETGAVEDRAAEEVPEQPGEDTGRARRARRRKSDQADRNDSFILHKFEAILSWATFVNMNRRVDDDDEDSARKAADDSEEISLGQVSKSPATRLRLHLDLAPEDADIEALAAEHAYPEWDTRRGIYLPAHVRVLAAPVEHGGCADAGFDPKSVRRINAVRRQFEALRPRRVSTPGHLDGDELDTDRAVRGLVDLRATGETDMRVWRQTLPLARDLAVSILIDVSRSTDGTVSCARGVSRRIIDIEHEALTALAWGLDACGDDFAISGFSSLKRERVFLHEVKPFGTPMNQAVAARIAALKPGFYTRLGAAIRHASATLATQTRKRRLLIVITDGKPNDLDHYEGRHGIEDSRRAVLEARRTGQSVFGITIDRDAKSWFPRIFGQGGFSLVSEPDRLTRALPRIYRQIVGV